MKFDTNKPDFIERQTHERPRFQNTWYAFDSIYSMETQKKYQLRNFNVSNIHYAIFFSDQTPYETLYVAFFRGISEQKTQMRTEPPDFFFRFYLLFSMFKTTRKTYRFNSTEIM